MNERTAPRGFYKTVWNDGQWHVVWAPDTNPEWWRWIGTFASQAHAADFAESNNQLENDDFCDWPPDTFTPEREDLPTEIAPVIHDAPEPEPLSTRQPVISPPVRTAKGDALDGTEEPEDIEPGPAETPTSENESKPQPALTGRAKDAYELFCAYADDGRELPVTHSQFLSEAGIPKGSHGYVRDTLEMRGAAQWLMPDNGRWGVRLDDGRELFGPIPEAPTEPEKPEARPKAKKVSAKELQPCATCGAEFFAADPDVEQCVSCRDEPPPEKAESANSEIALAKRAADWMQWNGYPVKTTDGGRTWECLGVERNMTPRFLIDWANRKRDEKGIEPFAISDEAARGRVA